MITHNGGSTNLLQWGCLALLLVSILTVALAGGWLLTKEPTSPPGPRPTAIIWTATLTPTATPTPHPTPTPVPTLPLSPDEVGIGVRVRVSGTGEAGLNMREAASTGAERRDVAREGEHFLVVDGPREGDGFTWWLLRDEALPEREGWAVADYLVIEQ